MKLSNLSDGADDVTWPVAMRFSIVILAALLLGIRCGQALPSNIDGLCNLFGMSGLAFYFCLELVADQRTRRRGKKSQRSTEQRLSQRLIREKKDSVSICAEAENGGKRLKMTDTWADLDAYVGPASQPAMTA